MGEAAETSEFVDVVHHLARDIQHEQQQHLCTSDPQATECEGKNEAGGGRGGGGEKGVEVLILDDPTYGPAQGAAFWLSTRMNPAYCEEIYTAQGIVSQYDTMKKEEEPHSEL